MIETMLRRLIPWIEEGGTYYYWIKDRLAVNFIYPSFQGTDRDGKPCRVPMPPPQFRKFTRTRFEADRYVLVFHYGPWETVEAWLKGGTFRQRKHTFRLSWMPRCGGLRRERW